MSYPILDWCVKEPKHNKSRYYDSPSVCSRRPILHCWHAEEDKDKPVCCWCQEEASFSAHTGLMPEELFWCYFKVLDRLQRSGKGPVIDGFYLMNHRTLVIGKERFAECIESRHTELGIRRLYMKSEDNVGREQKRMGFLLKELGILEANMANLRAGKIPKKFHKEALAEIEAQAWYLPEKATETRRNRQTKAVQTQIQNLKRSLAAKRRTKRGSK